MPRKPVAGIYPAQGTYCPQVGAGRNRKYFRKATIGNFTHRIAAGNFYAGENRLPGLTAIIFPDSSRSAAYGGNILPIFRHRHGENSGKYYFTDF